MDSPSGRGLLERFHRALFGPPALFWAVVLIALAYAYPDTAAEKLYRVLGLPISSLLLLAFAAAALLLFSAWIADLVRDDLYLWLEGYRWPVWMFHKGISLWEGRRECAKNRWEALAEDRSPPGQDKNGKGRPARDREFAQLDVWLHHLPQGDNLLPTAFGNVLRAAEEYVRLRYGLDPIVVWPRLWLLLSEERNELDNHRRALDAAVDGVLFGIVLLLLGAATLLLAVSIPLPLGGAVSLFLSGLLIVWFSYRLAVERARQFALLLQATFDIRRLRLYDALGCPRPNPDAEIEAGKQLAGFLWRGGRPPCRSEISSAVERGGEAREKSCGH